MESEKYCWSIGPIQSEWRFDDPDDAYEAAVRWKANSWPKDREIKIYRKLIEEVIF